MLYTYRQTFIKDKISFIPWKDKEPFFLDNRTSLNKEIKITDRDK